MAKVGVLGGGSWATALVKMLVNNCDVVNWWVRGDETAKYIQQYHHNPKYISSVEFDIDKLNVSTNISQIVADSDIVIVAVPSAFLKDSLSVLTAADFTNKLVFSAVKGIVPQDNLIVGEFMHQLYNVNYENIGVICGPCHAEEVALEKLSYLTVSCMDVNNAEQMADLLRCRYVKCTVSDDIYGTEYSAVLKNVIAVATGICHGLGYGDNFISVLISNAIQEIKRFVDAVHPIDRDINDSAYLGDLLVTCYSQFSRNRMFGNMVGKGYSVKAAQLEMNMVAEGYYATSCVHQINKKYNVHMPITTAVYNVLYEKISPVIEMRILSDNLS